METELTVREKPFTAERGTVGDHALHAQCSWRIETHG